MVMRPDVASVVGQVSEDRWGQVLITPHAYAVVEILSPIGVARERGIAILTELTKVFEEPPVSLAGLSAVADSAFQGDVVSLILLVPVGMTLYIVSRGSGRVYLKRQKQLAKLLDGTQSLSGDIKTGDALVVASDGFIRTLQHHEIENVFDHLTPTEVAEKLTMLLHEKGGGEGGAALIFQIGEAEPVEEPDKKTIEEVVTEPAPVSRTILFHKVKAVGRRITTPRQRQAIRNVAAKIRTNPHVSVKNIVAFGIALLFIVSVALGIFHQRAVKTHSILSDTISEAQHDFDEGMALLDLNPVKGRERLTQARDLLSPIVSRKLHTPDGQLATRLYGEVVDNLTRSMRITHVKPSVFFDPTLVKSGSTATSFTLFDDMMGLLDTNTTTVFTVSTANKNSAIVGGGTALSGVIGITIYGDSIYAYTPSGISMIRLTDQKTVPHIIPQSPEWGTIAQIVAFGGNLYLLDTQKSRIWKYVATDKGFSDTFEYLNPDTLPDLTHTTNMAIDGSVWLGTTTGDILRFSAGKENPYVPQGADTPLGKNLRVYTSDSDKMLYVLDIQNHRVVVFDKDGLYSAQYIWDNAFPVTDMAASETSGKLFLLAGGKVYAVNL